MQTKNIILKNRDVVYVTEEHEYAVKRIINKKFTKCYDSYTHNLLRIENIDGHLTIHSLPDTFTPEVYSQFVQVQPHTALIFDAADARSSIVIKQGRKDEELGLFAFDGDKQYANFDFQTFHEMVDTFAATNDYKKNYMDKFMEMFSDSVDFISSIPDQNLAFSKDIYDPTNFVNHTLLKYLSEERNKALKQIEFDNDERKF